jgi:hypothetical protein
VRVLVKVQTTLSPLLTAPSALIPFTDRAGWPLRVHSIVEL